MSFRLGHALHVTLMLWLTWLFLFGWLPLLRSVFDGPSYEWGDMLFGTQFRGAGTSGDFWYLIVKTAIGIALLWTGWRRPNGAFRIGLPLILGVMFLHALHGLLTDPARARFEGATLGIDISVAIIAPVLHGLLLALAVWWAVKAPPAKVRPMNMFNYTLIAAAAAMLPLQYAMLRSGQGQEVTDIAGVLMTIGGWFLLSLGLAPWTIQPAREEGLTAG